MHYSLCHTLIHMHACITHTHTHTHNVHTHIHALTCICTLTHSHACVRTHTHTHTHTHILHPDCTSSLSLCSSHVTPCFVSSVSQVMNKDVFEESDMCACLPLIRAPSLHRGVGMPTPPYAAHCVCLLEHAIEAACLTALSVCLSVWSGYAEGTWRFGRMDVRTQTRSFTCDLLQWRVLTLTLIGGRYNCMSHCLFHWKASVFRVHVLENWFWQIVWIESGTRWFAPVIM